MFLVLWRVLLVLLICFLFGCGETENSGLPEVTIGFLSHNETGSGKFLLTAEPPTRELKVLVEFVSERQGSFHRWEVIPKGAAGKAFTVPLDISASWEVSILRFWEFNVQDYPISGFGLSADDDSFSGYVLGSPSQVTITPFFSRGHGADPRWRISDGER